jgi:hypothetical protein
MIRTDEIKTAFLALKEHEKPIQEDLNHVTRQQLQNSEYAKKENTEKTQTVKEAEHHSGFNTLA